MKRIYLLRIQFFNFAFSIKYFINSEPELFLLNSFAETIIWSFSKPLKQQSTRRLVPIRYMSAPERVRLRRYLRLNFWVVCIKL